MSGELWDQPGADPFGDLAEWRDQMVARGGSAGAPLFVGAKAYDAMVAVLGRAPTVEDIPAGVPGRWTSIERVS